MKEYTLGELLPYKQPTPYIVKSTKYNDKYETPVLTPGKSFILGYTDEKDGVFKDYPVIIFDDFTTATKYVDFPFKVKSSAMKILEINTDVVIPKYIYYCLQSIHIEHSTHKRYWIQHYSKLKIQVPEKAKQEHIVAHIEELLSELDNGVETLKKTKEQLELYRQAVLKDAFSGRITHKWRQKNDVDFDWEIKDIKKVVKSENASLKAGPFGSSLKKECYVAQGFKVYGQEQVISNDENIGNYYIDEEKYHELFSCKIAPNDILISLVGTVGKVLILSEHCLPGIINPRLIKVSLDEKKMIPKFLKYYFESNYLRILYKQKAHGATMDVLNMGMIKELPFPVCSIEEQYQVVTEIESRLSVCDSVDDTIRHILLQTNAMRQSILKQAFEGES